MTEKRNAEKFWVWAELNRGLIRETLKAARRSIPGVHIVNVEPLIAEMTGVLHEYDARLQPLIALAADDVLELTITANGRRDAFVSAKSLVDCAPAGPSWRFYGLRRRRPVKHALLDGRELRGVESIQFGYTRNGEQVGVTLIVSDDLIDQLPSLQAAGRHVTMALLGEEDFGYHVAGTSVVSAAGWKAGHFDMPIWPLDELPSRVDALFHRELEQVA